MSFDDNEKNPDAFIADFGFAIVLEPDSNIESIYGTPGYVAPDVLRGGKYSFKSDIFSVGSIIYQIITGS